MEYAKNSNCRLGNGVGGDIRRAIDDEFARPGNSTHAPTGSKIEQAMGASGYPFIDQDGSGGLSASMYVKMASRSDNATADQVSFTIVADHL